MTVAELALSPLDSLRRALLRAGGGMVRPWLAAREPRVALFATVTVCGALTLSLAAPLWLLALTPILFGVPHLLADVRYLVVRPGLHRRRALWLAAVPLVAVSVTGDVHWGFFGVALAAGAANASRARRGLVVLLSLAGAALTWRFGYGAALVLAYSHNALAVVLWWRWRPRASRLHWLPVALFAGATVALLTGVLAATFAQRPGSLDLEAATDWLAPGFAAPLAGRLVVAFAFSQAVHYAIWLRLIPEDDRPGPAVRSFRASLASLRADFGLAPLLVCAALFGGVALWACVDLSEARVGYFRLALFHGHLELAALALLVLEPRR